MQDKVGKAAKIISTRTLGMQRMADDELFYYCQEHQMLIITCDEDFQNPLLVDNIPGYGVIRLNVYPAGMKQTQNALQRLLDTYAVREWQKASIIVDANKIRFRKK